jgi:hypothetical protein
MLTDYVGQEKSQSPNGAKTDIQALAGMCLEHPGQLFLSLRVGVVKLIAASVPRYVRK